MDEKTIDLTVGSELYLRIYVSLYTKHSGVLECAFCLFKDLGLKAYFF